MVAATRRTNAASSRGAITAVIVVLISSVSLITIGASSAAAAYAPELNREALAGIWRLTSRRSFLPTTVGGTEYQQHRTAQLPMPMKEFTVRPIRKKKKQPAAASTSDEYKDLLLKLSEDGSFEASDVSMDDDVDEEGEDEVKSMAISSGGRRNDDDVKIMRGTWDYLDGKLILATDRPDDVEAARHVHDTVLVGRVVAERERSLTDEVTRLVDKSNGGGAHADNGVQPRSGNEGDSKISSARSSSSSSSSDTSGDESARPDASPTERKRSPDGSSYDVHLSVPEGSVKVGRYMYPKSHPSFFDKPIYSPTRTGSFELRQVLGTLNAAVRKNDEDEELVERFRRDDLAGRRFFLTSHPLRYRRRNKPRWSRSLKCYVEDPVPVDPNEKINIRVVEVELFNNNTFATIAGLGSSTVLRGKWDVIGTERDHLWMQVWRFGFGRSVSGSTYSEGRSLTKEDEKTYWGKIEEVDHDEADGEDSIEDDPKSWGEKLLRVRGSVFFGWGLEPEPVARFQMMEKKEDLDTDDDDDEEEEDEDDDDRDAGEDDDAHFDSLGVFE